MKAIGRSPNVIGCATPRTRSREYVGIAGREVAGTDPSGGVGTTRIRRRHPVLPLL